MQDLDILKFFSGSSRRQRIQAFILNFSDEAHRHATALFQERHYHPTAALFCAYRPGQQTGERRERERDVGEGQGARLHEAGGPRGIAESGRCVASAICN